MSWIREAINDGKTGQASSKRVVVLMAGTAMSIAVVILAVAAMLGHPTGIELGAVCLPLAGMAGYSYVRGKIAEKESP